jgi:chromosome segregation ATPase
MNKNMVIGILAVMLVIASLWGQIGNKSHTEAKRQIEELSARVTQANNETRQGRDVLSMKTDKLQKSFQVKSQQLVKARQELVRLRKASKAFEARISEKDAAVATLTQEKNDLAGQVDNLKKILAAAKGSDQELTSLQKQLADLQVAFKDKDQQLTATTQALEEMKAALKEQSSSVDKRTENVDALQAKLNEAQATIRNLQAELQESTIPVQELQEKLAQAETANQELQGRLQDSEAALQGLQDKAAAAETIADQSAIARENESLAAQIVGLEKIIEDKNATIEETSKELDRWKVNMDVLLTRIAEQQDTLQELRDENRGLVKELAAKNQEIADLNEQLIQSPVQQ